MNNYSRQLANHILTELQKLGVVKKEQVNGTTTSVLATFIDQYNEASNMVFRGKND